jgi:hypothetical protein
LIILRLLSLILVLVWLLIGTIAQVQLVCLRLVLRGVYNRNLIRLLILNDPTYNLNGALSENQRKIHNPHFFPDSYILNCYTVSLL